MAGGQPREGAEGAAGGAPALGRGPGPGARAALGFRRGDVVMTPRGRRAPCCPPHPPTLPGAP